jgi:hypothetical protein
MAGPLLQYCDSWCGKCFVMKDEQDSFPVRHQPSRDVDGMIQVISGDETSASGL